MSQFFSSICSNQFSFTGDGNAFAGSSTALWVKQVQYIAALVTWTVPQLQPVCTKPWDASIEWRTLLVDGREPSDLAFSGICYLKIYILSECSLSGNDVCMAAAVSPPLKARFQISRLPCASLESASLCLWNTFQTFPNPGSSWRKGIGVSLRDEHSNMQQ